MTTQPVLSPPVLNDRRTGRAFTLIELLIVIGIITLLIVIGLAVGARVAGEGKRSATEQVIRVLDQTMTEYTATTDGRVPEMYTVEGSGPNDLYDFPLIDARLESADYDIEADPPVRSLAAYLALASQVPAVDEALRGLDAQLIREVELGEVNGETIRSREVLDGWGRPIRFVHPAFHGGYGQYYDPSSPETPISRQSLPVDVRSGGSPVEQDYRRSFRPFPGSASSGAVGDADEGMCIGGRPYFYSAGVDGDPGTRADNVYSIKPQFPAETAKLGE